MDETRNDRARQTWVTVSLAFCILGTLYGFGVIGAPVEEQAGGALRADATLIAPGKQAFSIWSVIYLGLLGYSIWQWLPAATKDARQRATGWLAGWTMILNASWLLVTQAGWLWVSVLVMIALVLTLGLLAGRLSEGRPASLVERVLVDGTFGLYLGWVSVATAANITAALVASGVTFGALADQIIAALVVLVAAGVGVALAWRLNGQWGVAGALSWGLVWVAIARLTDQPNSAIVGVTAIAAALVVVGAHAWASRRSVGQAQRAVVQS